MASAPAAPVLIASTSPRRRQVLGQLRIPSGAVVRPYEETEDDPVAHALGKDRSLLAEADGRPVRGCGTEISAAVASTHRPRNQPSRSQNSAVPVPWNISAPPSGAPSSSCARKFHGIIAARRVSCLCPDATDLDKEPM